MKEAVHSIFSIKSFTQKLMEDRRLVVTNIAGFLLVALIFGSLALMHTSNPVLLKTIQLVAFFGLGCANLSLMQTGSFLSRDFFQEYLIYALLVATIIMISLFCIYFLTGANILMAFGSVTAFLLPLAFVQTWFFYKHIPRSEEMRVIWEGEPVAPEPLAEMFRSHINVQIRIAKKYFDLREAAFALTASSWLKLGEVFLQFLVEHKKDHNLSIELKDKDDRAYGWEFYAERAGGFISRQLDPELTLRQNNINSEGIIVARRVRIH
jgi:hypothetical protein